MNHLGKFSLPFCLGFQSLHSHRWRRPKTCQNGTRPSHSVSKKHMLNIRGITLALEPIAPTYTKPACLGCTSVPRSQRSIGPDWIRRDRRKAVFLFAWVSSLNVRYWHKADICFCTAHVRFWG